MCCWLIDFALLDSLRLEPSGHGKISSESQPVQHYLVEPIHVVPFLAVACAIAVFAYVVHRRPVTR